jgi:hypothetical protein
VSKKVKAKRVLVHGNSFLYVSGTHAVSSSPSL